MPLIGCCHLKRATRFDSTEGADNTESPMALDAGKSRNGIARAVEIIDYGGY